MWPWLLFRRLPFSFPQKALGNKRGAKESIKTNQGCHWLLQRWPVLWRRPQNEQIGSKQLLDLAQKQQVSCHAYLPCFKNGRLRFALSSSIVEINDSAPGVREITNSQAGHHWHSRGCAHLARASVFGNWSQAFRPFIPAPLPSQSRLLDGCNHS